MPRASVDASALLDWGVAASALPGQAQSGDAHLVKAVATGVLVAVVDGLGHGAEAATAARTAVHTLTWAGVGNVDCMLFHVDAPAPAKPSRDSLVTRGGIVGSELPPVRAQVVPLARGDVLIFATDGIREGFSDGLQLEAPPQQVAEHILSQHGKGTDDALVLVARYRGGTRTN